MSNEEYLKVIEDWKLENENLIKSGKCKKIFLECLPRLKKNKGKRINWIESKNYKIKGIYNSLEFEFKIKSYNLESNMLTVIYNSNEFQILSGNFYKCKVGKILGEISKDFKIKVGQTFKDENRDIIITDRKIEQVERIYKKGRKSIENKKWYKYHCNKCGFDCREHYKNQVYKEEYWIEESGLIKGQGCSCCCNSSKIVVQGYNDIPTTAPWMVKYFQGGYNEAKMYTKYSSQTIIPICPDCENIKNKKMRICDIYDIKSIGCSCSDKIPYSEKIMFNILEQLGLDFQTQLSKTKFKWCNKYKYDFYFEVNNEQYIVETHGEQHYNKKGKNSNFKKNLKEQQENDKNKEGISIEKWNTRRKLYCN